MEAAPGSRRAHEAGVEGDQFQAVLVAGLMLVVRPVRAVEAAPFASTARAPRGGGVAPVRPDGT